MGQAAAKQKRRTSARRLRSADKYKYDRKKAERPIKWIEEYCTHPRGPLTGKKLKPPEWVKRDVIRPAFGRVRSNGLRRYSIVYVRVPSGNAKSTIGSALALYMLMGAGDLTPEVYCAAGSKDQAGAVFRPAKIMVLQNDDLKSNLSLFGNSIYDPETFGVLKVIPADANVQHGHSSTCNIFDELHVQPNGKLYEVLTRNVKRDEPITFIFTTAGVQGTFGETIYEYAKGVRDGSIIDDQFLPVIYEADPEDNDFLVKTWKKANPGWEYINQNEFRAQAQKAKNSATFLFDFRRYHLNKPTGTSVAWMTDERFMRGHAKGFSIDDIKGRDCYVGVDFASNRDTCAVEYAIPPIDEEERWKFITRVFIPEGSLVERSERETVQYRTWAEEGHIIITPGNGQNYEHIRGDIEEHGKMFVIKAIGYDSWNANETVQYLEGHGLPMMAYQQNFKWMNAPMRKLENMIDDGQIEHNAHPVLRWQFGHVQAENDRTGRFIRPTRKKGETTRIDAPVAMIVAIGTYIIKISEELNKPPESIITQKGVFIIQNPRNKR